MKFLFCLAVVLSVALIVNGAPRNKRQITEDEEEELEDLEDLEELEEEEAVIARADPKTNEPATKPANPGTKPAQPGTKTGGTETKPNVAVDPAVKPKAETGAGDVSRSVIISSVYAPVAYPGFFY